MVLMVKELGSVSARNVQIAVAFSDTVIQCRLASAVSKRCQSRKLSNVCKYVLFVHCVVSVFAKSFFKKVQWHLYVIFVSCASE